MGVHTRRPLAPGCARCRGSAVGAAPPDWGRAADTTTALLGLPAGLATGARTGERRCPGGSGEAVAQGARGARCQRGAHNEESAPLENHRSRTFFTPPVAGALLRAALVASCLRGALPPVLLLQGGTAQGGE